MSKQCSVHPISLIQTEGRRDTTRTWIFYLETNKHQSPMLPRWPIPDDVRPTSRLSDRPTLAVHMTQQWNQEHFYEVLLQNHVKGIGIWSDIRCNGVYKHQESFKNHDMAAGSTQESCCYRLNILTAHWVSWQAVRWLLVCWILIHCKLDSQWSDYNGVTISELNVLLQVSNLFWYWTVCVVIQCINASLISSFSHHQAWWRCDTMDQNN